MENATNVLIALAAFADATLVLIALLLYYIGSHISRQLAEIAFHTRRIPVDHND